MMYAIANTTTVFQRWTRLLVLTLERPDGQLITREVEDHGDAAAVLAYHPLRRTAILVEQFRPPRMMVGESGMSLELIAGLLDGEPPETAARREAMEEAGLRLGALEIVRSWTMPGISTERTTIFLGEYNESDRIGIGGGLAHEQEEITVQELG